MVRNQCNAQAHFSDGAIYVCTKWSGHTGPHHAYDADTNVEFYRDDRDKGGALMFPDCVLPGCRNPVAEHGDACSGCVTQFGDMLRPADRLTADEIQERDRDVRQQYAAQRQTRRTPQEAHRGA
jgi:hypothetical protein